MIARWASARASPPHRGPERAARRTDPAPWHPSDFVLVALFAAGVVALAWLYVSYYCWRTGACAMTGAVY